MTPKNEPNQSDNDSDEEMTNDEEMMIDEEELNSTNNNNNEEEFNNSNKKQQFNSKRLTDELGNIFPLDLTIKTNNIKYNPQQALNLNKKIKLENASLEFLYNHLKPANNSSDSENSMTINRKASMSSSSSLNLIKQQQQQAQQQYSNMSVGSPSDEH